MLPIPLPLAALARVLELASEEMLDWLVVVIVTGI
jgi:hypothetical protein